MSKHVLRIDPYDKKSVEAAIRYIRNLRKDINEKRKVFIEKLANVGLAVAQVRFVGGESLGNGNVVVTTEPTKNGFKVVASGEDVCFIEFGTGVYAGLGYEGNTGEVPVFPGSWSQSENGEGRFVPGIHEYWYYAGNKVEGTVPQKGMYFAAKEIRRAVERIAKDVFGA